MIKRSLDPYDQIFIATNQWMQFAVHLKNPSMLEPVLDKVKKMLVATKIRLDGNQLVKDENANVPIVKLPEHFDSMQDACIYMHENHTPKLSDSLGCIGVKSSNFFLLKAFSGASPLTAPTNIKAGNFSPSFGSLAIPLTLSPLSNLNLFI